MSKKLLLSGSFQLDKLLGFILLAMATANDNSSLLSSEAFDLLDCFVSGLDDVVYGIAEEIAKSRPGVRGDAPVRIEVQDIRDAAEKVFRALRSAEGFPPALAGQIEHCFREKCGAL